MQVWQTRKYKCENLVKSRPGRNASVVGKIGKKSTSVAGKKMQVWLGVATHLENLVVAFCRSQTNNLAPDPKDTLELLILC